MQAKTVEPLGQAYFEREKDTMDHAVLREAGVQACLDPDQLNTFLKSDEAGDLVYRDVADARRRGGQAVPSINLQSYEVGGTERTEDWQALLNL